MATTHLRVCGVCPQSIRDVEMTNDAHADWYARNSVFGAVTPSKHYYAIRCGGMGVVREEDKTQIYYPTVGSVLDKEFICDSISPTFTMRTYESAAETTLIAKAIHRWGQMAVAPVPERKDRIPHMQRAGFKRKFK